MQWNKLDYAMQTRRPNDDGMDADGEPRCSTSFRASCTNCARGLPVSMTENLDAMRAVEHVRHRRPRRVQDRARRDAGQASRHHNAFDTVFDVYFSLFSPGVDGGEAGERRLRVEPSFDQLRGQTDGGGATGQLSHEELAQMLLDALMRMDSEQLRRLAARGGGTLRRDGARPSRRRRLLPVPDVAAARRRRPRRQNRSDQAQQDEADVPEDRSTNASSAKSTKVGSRS